MDVVDVASPTSMSATKGPCEYQPTWSRLTQPVGTLLVSLALVRRDASLLPHLVGAVIELLSGRTLALLSGENAVIQLADEIKGRIVDANFVTPTLSSRIHRLV